jgi:hypothetical protein
MNKHQWSDGRPARPLQAPKLSFRIDAASLSAIPLPRWFEVI